MDEQAKEILDILHQHDISYWLDSGTLLGLMREGRLLEFDEDIDLGVWGTEEAKIKKLLPLLRQLGYVVYSASYQGQVFKHNLVPQKKGLRKVDINIFQEFGSHAWCPLYYFKVNPTKESAGPFKRVFLGSIKGGFRRLWKKFNTRVPVHIEISSFPWRNFLNIGTWWIPAGYLKDLTYHEQWQAYIPADWEQYLEFRYGQWQEQAQDWVFFRDDGGIKPLLPAELTTVSPSTARYGP